MLLQVQGCSQTSMPNHQGLNMPDCYMTAGRCTARFGYRYNLTLTLYAHISDTHAVLSTISAAAVCTGGCTHTTPQLLMNRPVYCAVMDAGKTKLHICAVQCQFHCCLSASTTLYSCVIFHAIHRTITMPGQLSLHNAQSPAEFCAILSCCSWWSPASLLGLPTWRLNPYPSLCGQEQSTCCDLVNWRASCLTSCLVLLEV